MSFMPDNISSFGFEIDRLTVLITVLGVACLLIAEACLFYAVVRFRKGAAPRASFITGDRWAQARWVILPVLLVCVLDFFIDVRNAHAWHAIKEYLPKPGMRVRITGEQFAWTFTYAGRDGELGTRDDVKSVGELHVPVDTDVVFELQAKDVLHSLWVPALRLKQDAVPGRTIAGWFRATRTGRYDIGCAQLCGTGHSRMAATLVVEYPQDFDAWMGRQLAPTYSSPGERLAKEKGCLGCHTTDGTVRVGPTWKGLLGRRETVLTDGHERELPVDDAYLRRSMLRPGADIVKGFPNLMPSQEGKLTDAEMGQIIDYMKTLR